MRNRADDQPRRLMKRDVDYLLAYLNDIQALIEEWRTEFYSGELADNCNDTITRMECARQTEAVLQQRRLK